MNKHKVEQRRLVFKGREFHFVSYEGQVANAARAIEATEASWFLMSAGKRWEVMPHSPDQEALEVDRRLMAWLKERMASYSLPMSLRSQTLGEEIANSVSHGVGLVASLAAAPFLIGSMLRRGDGMLILAAGIFAVTVVLLYLSSTLYHAIPASRAKRVLQVVDHSAIYLLIAGTYTPFALGVLRGPWGWTLLTVVWLCAALGVALKTTKGIVWPRLSTALYLAMGWLALVAARPIMREVPLPGLLWITAGGLAYTAGVAFFAADRLRYGHFVWHLFVLAGTTCHYVAILQYA